MTGNRAKTIKLEVEGHTFRKGMTIEPEGQPRSIVTRVKGNTVWMLPVPVPEPVAAPVIERVMGLKERLAAALGVLRTGRRS